ncbi:protein stum homolog [Saccoglossus kowalevskii]|uniref:Protein SPEC3-like n=1 Tax=Saccoglossus kowalevskii TaxID=10224 RepID=A0ABM0GZT5_SACKO|nr:PREDICTED: protein SPEC3-like [Saccoglossus kowalevskii]
MYPRQHGGPLTVSSRPPSPPPLSGRFATRTIGSLGIETSVQDKKYAKYAKFVDVLPVMHQCWAWTCFILNTIVPGIGSILAAFIVLTCCAKHDGIGDRCRVSCIQFWSAIGMLVTSPLIIGFIWSAWWGWMYIPISLLKYHGTLKDEPVEGDTRVTVVVTEVI